MAHCEVPDGAVQCGRQWSPQARVRTRLDLARAPTAPDGHRPQFAEQYRLAHTAQAGQHEAAFRSTASDPLQDDVERFDFAVAAREFGRSLTGAGREGISDRVHLPDFIRLSSFQAIFGKKRPSGVSSRRVVLGGSWSITSYTNI
ncbi:hypothetical protein GCM10027563_22160 [Parasphingorhabdus pacifica]